MRILLCMYGNFKNINDIDDELDVENNVDKDHSDSTNNKVTIREWNNERQEYFNSNIDIDEINDLPRKAEDKSVPEGK